MSAHQQQFAQLVRSAPAGPVKPVQRSNTYMRYCSICDENTMHYRYDDYSQCSDCLHKVYRSEQGSALLEMVFWTAVVLFVLICLLGGRPW